MMLDSLLRCYKFKIEYSFCLLYNICGICHGFFYQCIADVACLYTGEDCIKCLLCLFGLSHLFIRLCYRYREFIVFSRVYARCVSISLHDVHFLLLKSILYDSIPHPIQLSSLGVSSLPPPLHFTPISLHLILVILSSDHVPISLQSPFLNFL